jgi:hypothetical protein
LTGMIDVERSAGMPCCRDALGIASAAGLGVIDVCFAARGRIAKVYLLDAAIEAALVAGWGAGKSWVPITFARKGKEA